MLEKNNNMRVWIGFIWLLWTL